MARRAVLEPSAAAVSEELADAIAGFVDDPLGFVLFAYPWGEEGTWLANQAGPDEWQTELLDTIGAECRKRRPGAAAGAIAAALGAIQIATASGHGVGKTAFVAWLIQWFMSTRHDPQVIVTANTQGQLNGKTWRELAKWHRGSINADWFTWTATTFYFKARPETHKASAVPWTKERSEAFAGTHDENVLMIFDEASAIDDNIWLAGDGAMTTTGAIWVCFGNPTRNKGRFRECWRLFRHRWITRQVDSRGAKMANKVQIQGWIDDYGEDSDFVRVRVKGEFPRAGTLQLIGQDLVDNARHEFKRRHGDNIRNLLKEGPEGGIRQYVLDENVWSPKIFVVDVARYGGDQIVFGIRQAKCFVPLFKSREMDVPQIAYRAHEWIMALEPDHIVVDGGGVGGGVVDMLRELGHEVWDVIFGAKAIEDRRFFNRRAEMYWKTRQWLIDGGMIPYDDQELAEDLTGPEYGFSDRGDRIQIESKDDMRARGLPSPDTGDALVMSFFMNFAPVDRGETIKVAAKIGMAAARQDDGGTSWKSL